MTNYRGLFDQIRHFYREKPVCIVTFNYDTLIESALQHYGMSFAVLPDYVSAPQFKLFKLHGWQNWARLLQGPIPMAALRGNDIGGPWGKAAGLIKYAASLTGAISNAFIVTGTGGQPISAATPLYPAIAIPVTNKSEFECPAEHVQQLQSLMPAATKILSVGWRGTEHHFLRLLEKHVNQEVSVAVVAKDVGEAAETYDQLREQVKLGIKAHAEFEGFSDTINDRALDEFLAS